MVTGLHMAAIISNDLILLAIPYCILLLPFTESLMCTVPVFLSVDYVSNMALNLIAKLVFFSLLCMKTVQNGSGLFASYFSW